MKTIADDYAAMSDSIKLHKKQDDAVGDYLIEHGEVENDFLYNIGLPACGRIKNPRQRIHELRAKGWQIRTVTDRMPGKCFYVFISKPGGQSSFGI